MYKDKRQELAGICHLLYDRNLVTASDGNVSLLMSGEHILLTPSAKNKIEILESVAKTVIMARLLGEAQPIDRESMKKLILN